MKKLSIIITGLALFLGTTAFAGEGERSETYGGSAPKKTSGSASVTVNKEITKSFATKFSSAENVYWKQRDDFYFADFKLNQKEMSAAYNAEGELLAYSRNLELSQLPLQVETSIREKYADYKIDNIVTEMILDGETTYHLQVENKSRLLKLKCDSQGQISVVKRTKKKLVGSVY